MRAPAILLAAGLIAGCTDGRRRQPNRPPPPPPTTQDPVELMLRNYTHPVEVDGLRAPMGRRWLELELTTRNQAGAAPIPGGASAYRVQTVTGSSHDARPDRRCPEQSIAVGSSLNCTLVFEIAVGVAPATLHYDDGSQERIASFDGVPSPPNLCPEPSEENTPLACNDGCNNDGDPYFDCDDADCCSVRADCLPGTYCGGGQIECVSGPETRFNSCRDGCDNEGDSRIDCEDLDCCDIVACGAATACGAVPDAFAEAPPLDDARIDAVDPALLPAGDAPCRGPVLVTVTWTRDGDTIEVTGGVEGAVRLIGVDTPELTSQPPECYANNAYDFTRLLTGRRVWLTFDGECQDRFDRWLAYVHLGPGPADMWQRQLLRRGLGTALIVQGNVSLAPQLEYDAAIAAQAGTGLWGACN